MSVVFFPSVNHLAFSFGCLHLNPSPFVVWFYGLIINIINNFVILYRLLQKEFFLLNELIKQVKEIEGKDDFVAKVDEWGD